MEKVGQFIYGNEILIPLSHVKTGELFFNHLLNKINVYQKTKTGNLLIKTVANYKQLQEIKELNLEPDFPNFICFD